MATRCGGMWSSPAVMEGCSGVPAVLRVHAGVDGLCQLVSVRLWWMHDDVAGASGSLSACVGRPLRELFSARLCGLGGV